MGRTSNARERMLEAAEALIWKQSYGAVTMDAICTAADVHAGSFYHFFDSKAAVAAAAFAALWEYEKFRLDQIFSAPIPALERLGNYCGFLYEHQLELKQKHGCVVGSPFTCLASELSQRADAICLQMRTVVNCHRKYLELVLWDAQAEGAMEFESIPAAAQRVSAYVEGCLLQARIHNDVRGLRELGAGVLDLIRGQAAPSPKSRG